MLTVKFITNIFSSTVDKSMSSTSLQRQFHNMCATSFTCAHAIQQGLLCKNEKVGNRRVCMTTIAKGDLHAQHLHWLVVINVSIYFINTQESTVHSAAPSVCITSGIQTVHMNMTGTGKQNFTSRDSTATQPQPWAHACQPGTPSHWTLQAFPSMAH
jgi:hypothetical protein